MADTGSYQIPKEFKDEDKWLRYFTKKQLGYAAIAIAIDIGLLFLTYKIGIIHVGIFFSVLILMAILGFAFMSVPTSKYLLGGGYPLSTIAFRIIRRHLPKNRVIYVKNYKGGSNSPF